MWKKSWENISNSSFLQNYKELDSQKNLILNYFIFLKIIHRNKLQFTVFIVLMNEHCKDMGVNIHDFLENLYFFSILCIV